MWLKLDLRKFIRRLPRSHAVVLENILLEYLQDKDTEEEEEREEERMEEMVGGREEGKEVRRRVRGSGPSWAQDCYMHHSC